MITKAIKPWHLFNHRGGWYVIDINGMAASAIDDVTARVLEETAVRGMAALDPQEEEELRKLGLIADVTRKVPEAGQEEEPIPIMNMCLFLTQSCNLRCIYCYGGGGEYGKGGHMDEKTAFQAVDWMIIQSLKLKKLHISFFGGEPLLSFPLMKAVVEYAERRVSEAGKDVVFHGTTNATLLDDEKIAFLKEHQIAFMVSFDGTKELQDRQRPYPDGRGSYDSTVPGIKKLIRAMPETQGHAVIVGTTDPQEVKDALLEIGFAETTVMPVSRSLFSGKPDKREEARETQHFIRDMEEEAERWIAHTRERDIDALKILKGRSSIYYGIVSLLHGSKRFHACDAGLGMVAVSCSGDVYLCHRFVGRDEYRLGSIFEKELNREEYKQSPAKGNKLCTACFARFYCAGGCKHDNVGACGSISTPSEDMCRLRCRGFELAAVITSRLDSEDRAFLVEQDIFPPRPCPLDF